MKNKQLRQPSKPKATDSVGYHRQSRQVLSQISKTIAPIYQGPDIFSQPKYFDKLMEGPESNTMTIRCAKLIIELGKNISKPNPVGRYDQEQNIFILDNLGQLSKELDISPDKLKTALIGLCSFPYPHLYQNNHGEVVEEYSKLFSVRFIYDEKTMEKKYGVVEIDGDRYYNAPRIGTKQANYIANERAKRIEIIPHQKIIEAINKGANGGYITTSDDITTISKDLSVTELQLLTYIGSKPKNYRAKMSNVVKDLNMADQIKKQGKPRIYSKILDGLETLKTKRVISDYEYNTKTEVVSWTQDKNTYDYDGPRKSSKTPQS